MESQFQQDHDDVVRDEEARLKSEEQTVAYISARSLNATVAALVPDLEAVFVRDDPDLHDASGLY